MVGKMVRHPDHKIAALLTPNFLLPVARYFNSTLDGTIRGRAGEVIVLGS